ncbi:uncharacterized protein At2g39795, mitochondrial [Morus notabilis]|uniref:uncharacterized protein At2g39795, mitochondrial n=1 Tax=Morus notabilis TaxID=981085 RepID=UPI000CED5CF1|nr:uncharacterized protein At2g39795, mitochondrial [Morus notabilis]
MWRKVLTCALQNHPWRTIAFRRSSTSVSSAVDSMILRSLKDHYLEVSKMAPPPKVDPPSEFSVVKGALDNNGPVLRRSYGDNEEIRVSVMRLANIIPDGAEADGGGDGEDDDINQLFLHVEVSKAEEKESLHFLCGLYPDALGIHSVSMRPKLEPLESNVVTSSYSGPVFEDLDERMRDAFHGYIDERGVNDSLFPFLQAWLYVKDHRKLMHWFKSVGTFINDNRSAKDA